MSNQIDTPTATVEKVFAIFRNDFRVSNSEYPNTNEAQHEYNYWKGILSRWPDGSRLSIRELKWRRKEAETQDKSE